MMMEERPRCFRRHENAFGMHLTLHVFRTHVLCTYVRVFSLQGVAGDTKLGGTDTLQVWWH